MALSAPLLWRKRVVLVKIETEKGTEVTGDTAIQCYDLEINQTAPNIERHGTNLFLGNNVPGVIGELTGVCSFKTELREGSSAATMEPGLAILLQACGLKQTTQVYQVHSAYADQKSISIDVYEDGIQKTIFGAMGNVTFEAEAGGRVMCNFEFSGKWKAPADVALPAFAPATTLPARLSAGTFTIATNAIKIGKFSLNMGNQVTLRPDGAGAGGINCYMITDYKPVLTIDPEADLVAGYGFHAAWLAKTAQVVALAVKGDDTFTFDLPAVVTTDLKEGERNGIAIYDFTGECLNSSAILNDAVKISVT